jgi:hypothetical protein
MLCRVYKLTGKRVKLEGSTTIVPLSPRDLLIDGARDLLREAGSGYRAETSSGPPQSPKRAYGGVEGA